MTICEGASLDVLEGIPSFIRITYLEEPTTLPKASYYHAPHLSMSGDIMWRYEESDKAFTKRMNKVIKGETNAKNQ